jgi:transcription elongation factor Elf1
VEHFFTCPYCGEQISMVIDLSVRQQTYVEDCEVCCNPIEITCKVKDDSIDGFNAKTLE